MGRGAVRLAHGCRRPVRRTPRLHPVARRAQADVRARARRAAAGQLSQPRRRACPAPKAQTDAPTAQRHLWRRARRAVHHRGSVSLPGRQRQRRLARRQDRPQRLSRHHDCDFSSASAPRGFSRCAHAVAAGRCGSRTDTATCWSWAGRASARGNTRFRRRRGRSAHGSASSSARTTSARR